MLNNFVSESMTVKLDSIFKQLPAYPEFLKDKRRAPKREFTLNERETELALRNALRYVPEEWHEVMAPEFLEELLTRGRIYGYRFRPHGGLKGKPINEYKGNCLDAKAFQVMIDNNLDFDIALYPYELVTYGETGQVCQNWMQYQLIKRYLELMTNEQTLVVASGHPVGLFKSHAGAPRVIITNALMIGMYDNHEDWHRAMQLGVANYGQMTAGGWMYIGPQGIVHGTYSTLLNAGRSKLGIAADKDLKGNKGWVDCIIDAEVDYSRIVTRHEQGWAVCIIDNPAEAFKQAKQRMNKGEAFAIAFYGNVVDLLKYAVDNNIKIDLLSDQTSCHAVYEGGYCPQGISFEQRTSLLENNKAEFKKLVDNTLQSHYQVIKSLVEQGTYFFDYGNSFLKAVYDTGIKEIAKNGYDTTEGFIFPSYVEDIMGPELFDYGYGPFRWVCLSGKHEDLIKTDKAAMDCIDPNRRFQDRDNWAWIRDAEKNQLVVGTQARILYQDAYGRMNIALKFNEMVRKGEVGAIMLGRDHHDTGGTDSPFRETSNIKDGSNIMADMATHCFAGNAARGMSLIALHNGGGVGIGKSINGGFGLVLDGSERIDEIIKSAMLWDVMGGVARRGWARNKNAMQTAADYNNVCKGTDHITLPYIANDDLIKATMSKMMKS
ncbi:urocanate hydratase [Clostridium sp. 'deep sea']|uniref:urocanate hydratase n=1 Tax=Clostridium sp. 'deep sea' TaxID=2779445 RepID=UPI0018965685|nr:urocanate hydratase [Clostridium sp. 'deep sea']QOR36143.1 urocanate hydratase [Clostridium sp. 'deep sea']